jgi:predicted transcriptional regulator
MGQGKKVEIDLEKIESFAALGLTREQVAHNLGFTSRTWQNYNKDGSLEDAYMRGKSKGISVIANALYQKAKQGNTTAQIFFLKCNGWKESSEVEVKNTSPVQLVIKNDLKE